MLKICFGTFRRLIRQQIRPLLPIRTKKYGHRSYCVVVFSCNYFIRFNVDAVWSKHFWSLHQYTINKICFAFSHYYLLGFFDMLLFFLLLLHLYVYIWPCIFFIWGNINKPLQHRKELENYVNLEEFPKCKKFFILRA